MEEFIKMDLTRYEKTLQLDSKARAIIAEKEESDREFKAMREDRDVYKSIIDNLDKDMTLYMIPRIGVTERLRNYSIGWLTKDKSAGILIEKIGKIREELNLPKEKPTPPPNRVEIDGVFYDSMEDYFTKRLKRIPTWIRKIFGA